MSQLEGGRSQAAFVRSGGGTIQRQNLLSLDVNPLRVAPPVSTSANQLDQLNQTISAAASTIAQGGRYADWLRQKREVEAEAHRRANEENQKRADAIASATAKIDEANGSVVGKAFRQQYLIDIESGALAVPQELSGVDKAMWVRDQAIAAAREKYGTQATDAFVSGVAKELDPDVFLKEADQRLKTRMKEDASAELASRRSILLKVTDPKQVEGVVSEAVQLLSGIHPPEYVRKELLTPAIEAAAVAGDPERVAMLAKPLGGLEDKWVSERMDEARKIGEQAERNRLHANNQAATEYLTNQITMGKRFDPGIEDYVDFAFEQKAITADERKSWKGQIQNMRDRHAEEVQKQIDAQEADNQASAQLSTNLSHILSGNTYLVDDIKVTSGSATRSIPLDEQKRLAFDVVKAESAKLYPDDPIRQIEHQIDYVSQSRNMPSEWSQVLSVGESAADSLLLDTADGKESPIPTQTAAAFELYKSIAARSPSILSELIPYEQRKFYERTMSAQRRGAVGNDVRAAMLSAKNSIKLRPNRVDLSATTLVASMQEMGVDMTNGLWGGPNPTWTATENAFANLVDLFADYSPAEAAKRAAEELKPKIVNVNGFKTLMTNPPAPQNKDAFEESVNDRLLAIAESKKLSLGDLYVVEDVSSGMLRVSDRSTLTVVDSIDPRELAKPMQENKAKFAVVGQNFMELVRTNPALMLSYNEFAKSMSPAKAKQAVVDSFSPKSARRDTQDLRSKQGIGIDMSIADDMSVDLKTRYPNIQ